MAAAKSFGKGCLGAVLLMGGCLVLVDQFVEQPDEKAEAAAEAPARSDPEPARAVADPAATEAVLKELDGLVGLEGVKAEVRKIVALAQINEARRAQGLELPRTSYHMVFTGNPGTGKTTVARLVARAFVSLGIIGNRTLVEVDRSGLVGEYAGQTAVKTNAKIDEALGLPPARRDASGQLVPLTAAERAKAEREAPGGVLFIDEAYELVAGEQDSYGREALATIMKRMEDNRDKLIVIVAGYTDEMREFLDANPGLRSRFDRQIEFADYSTAELEQIFRSMAKKAKMTLAPDLDAGLAAALAKLTKRRDRTFGNARFVRQLFEGAIGRQAERLTAEGALDAASLSTLTLADLGVGEKKVDLHAPTIEEVLAELDELTGLEPVKAEIRRLIATCRANRLREAQGLGDGVTMSYNFVFTGNPGTGKTTVARLLGKAFRALGLLERGTFVETDRSGLVAAYSGQTALKTNKLVDSAMGGVLFIDEAYQLNNGDNDAYGREALATLLKRMEDARGSMVVIVAGYKDEMTRFMAANSGLESRFNRQIEFPDYSAADLAAIFRSQAKKARYVLSADAEKYLQGYISIMTKNRNKNFGNARWARNLFERAVERQAERMLTLPAPTATELMTLTLRDIGIVLKDPAASDED